MKREREGSPSESATSADELPVLLDLDFFFVSGNLSLDGGPLGCARERDEGKTNPDDISLEVRQVGEVEVREEMRGGTDARD